MFQYITRLKQREKQQKTQNIILSETPVTMKWINV